VLLRRPTKQLQTMAGNRASASPDSPNLVLRISHTTRTPSPSVYPGFIFSLE